MKFMIRFWKTTIAYLLCLNVLLSACSSDITTNNTEPSIETASVSAIDLTPEPVLPTITPYPTLSSEGLTWLEQEIFPLSGVNPDLGCVDLAPILAKIDGAHIVALGESTHATREFFLLRSRIINCLVQEQGFNLLAVEANWTESLAVNNAIQNNQGDLASALQGLYFWHLNTESFLAMLEWMQEVNAGDPETIRFAGFDMQFTRGTTAQIEKFIKIAAPDLTGKVREDLDCFKKYVVNSAVDPSVTSYYEQSSTIHSECRTGLTDIEQAFSNNETNWISAAGESSYLEAEHALELLLQAEQLFAEPDQQAAINLRDKFMAENVLWLLEQGGPETRMIIWAQNGHLHRKPAEPEADGFVFIPMGTHLSNALGNDLYTIGLDFGNGSFNAYQVDSAIGLGRGLQTLYVSPPLPNSFEDVLSNLSPEIYYLDLSLIENSPAGNWFKQPHWMRNIGAAYDPDNLELTSVWGRLQDWFDGLIYIQHTNPTILRQ
jgi:erythromycin esterase